MNRKIYNENMVRLCTFLAGPLGGAYLMAQNYRTFGDEKRARKAILVGAGVTALIFGILLSLPEPVADKIPNFLLPLVFAFMAQFFVRKFQAPAIENYLTEGGQKHSNWKVAGVALLVLAVEIIIAVTVIFGAVYFFE